MMPGCEGGELSPGCVNQVIACIPTTVYAAEHWVQISRRDGVRHDVNRWREGREKIDVADPMVHVACQDRNERATHSTPFQNRILE